MLDLMFITNDSMVAKNAVMAGVNRIFIDIEGRGKAERQKNRDTYISNHSLEDVLLVREAVPNVDLMVRVNAIYENSQEEIERCIDMGVDSIMLPMFKTVEEVTLFMNMVKGRARTCLLLETPQALVRIDKILQVPGIDEIHIGLNDLHLGMGMDFMFELLEGGIVEYLASKIKEKKIKFGFGGIAKIGQGVIPAEMIIGEHYRIGSTMVILSRSFRKDAEDYRTMFREIEKIRDCEKKVVKWKKEEYEKNRENLSACIREYLLKKDI